ncbi:MAG: type II secretion system protein M [Gammaproteobacteria bacterium]|nr:type II secretion system protein M [Gammaproteobacteria bacterium]
MNKLRLWWDARAVREQLYLALGAIIAVFLIIYLVVISPINSAVTNLKIQVRQQQALAQWLTPRVPLLQGLSAKSGVVQPVTSTNLLATVDMRLKQSQFANSVTEISQSDASSVRVSFNSVSFDDLMLWLAQQWQQSRIAVVQIDVQKTGDAGLAKVVLILATS